MARTLQENVGLALFDTKVLDVEVARVKPGTCRMG
jgi:hypothetical protein